MRSIAPPMFVRLLRAKLHQATVTATHLNYHGSVTIDQDLCDAVGLLPHEVVTVANLANGERGETYVLVGKRGSAVIELNGAMARLAQPGDKLIIFSYAYVDPTKAEQHKPKVAVLGPENRIIEKWEG